MKIEQEEIREFISEYEEDINSYIEGTLSKESFMNGLFEILKANYDYEHYSRLLFLACEHLKKNDDRCSYCGTLISDDYYLYRRQKGTHVDWEHICIGHLCWKCKGIHLYE